MVSKLQCAFYVILYNYGNVYRLRWSLSRLSVGDAHPVKSPIGGPPKAEFNRARFVLRLRHSSFYLDVTLTVTDTGLVTLIVTEN